MGAHRIRHPAKYLSRVFGPGLLLLAAGACMPLPQEGGVAVSAGAMSDQWVIRADPVLGTPNLMTKRPLQDLGAIRHQVRRAQHWIDPDDPLVAHGPGGDGNTSLLRERHAGAGGEQEKPGTEDPG